MDEDDAWEAMEELYRDEKIDRVQGNRFTLNDQGVEFAEQLLRENPEHVEFLCLLHLNKHGVDGDNMNEFLHWIRDEVGINPMESLIEADPDWFDTEGIRKETIATYEPSGADTDDYE